MFQTWTALIQKTSELTSSETELISAEVLMFSESAMKNIKPLKHRCSAMIFSGTSIRSFWIFVIFRSDDKNCYIMFLKKINLKQKITTNFHKICRNFRNLTSNSIKPWYHCSRDGEWAEIHKKIYNSKIKQWGFNSGGGGVLLRNICLTL